MQGTVREAGTASLGFFRNGFKTRSLFFAIPPWGQIFRTWEGVWDLAITKSPGVPRVGNWAMTGQAVRLWFELSCAAGS